MKELIDPKTTALRFNDCINNRDIDGLVGLMTDDHAFVGMANDRVDGRSNNRINWVRFFGLFPIYRNVFETVTAQDSLVIMQGYSVCCDERLNNLKAIWTARIEGDKVKEWSVCRDNEDNRAYLGL